MSGLSCRYIRSHLGEIVRDTLAPPERIRVELHLGECAKCRKAVQTCRGFESFVKTAEVPDLPPLVERHYIIAALDGREPEGPVKKASRQTARPLWVGAGIFATAAAAIFSIALSTTSQKATHTAPATASQSEVITKSVRPLPLPEAPSEPPTTPAVISDRRDPRLLIEVGPGIQLWVREDSVLTTKVITDLTARFFLARGHVVAEVTTDIPGYRFIVETPSGEVEAKGTIFSVETRPDGKEIARVIEGSVEVRRHRRHSEKMRHYLLHTGQQGIVGSDRGEPAQADGRLADRCLLDGCLKVEQTPSKRDAPEPSPRISKAPAQRAESKDEPARENPRDDLAEMAPAGLRKEVDALTSSALEQRKRGEYLTAAKTYERIIDLEGSTSSSNALVSLGQLELIELRRYRLAVSHFERYLNQNPKGYLAEEARLGRVQAFESLRDWRGIISAANDYLEHHQDGYAGAEVLLMRADAKRQTGDCRGAVVDYRSILKLWPASRGHIRVETGLRLCDERP